MAHFVKTEGELVDLAEAIGIEFVTGKIYTLQIKNACYLKIGDNDEFEYDSKDLLTYNNINGDTLYIKTAFDNACYVSVVSVA